MGGLRVTLEKARGLFLGSCVQMCGETEIEKDVGVLVVRCSMHPLHSTGFQTSTLMCMKRWVRQSIESQSGLWWQC